jgi:hypothetical protein
MIPPPHTPPNATARLQQRPNDDEPLPEPLHAGDHRPADRCPFPVVLQRSELLLLRWGIEPPLQVVPSCVELEAAVLASRGPVGRVASAKPNPRRRADAPWAIASTLSAAAGTASRGCGAAAGALSAPFRAKGHYLSVLRQTATSPLRRMESAGGVRWGGAQRSRSARKRGVPRHGSRRRVAAAIAHAYGHGGSRIARRTSGGATELRGLPGHLIAWAERLGRKDLQFREPDLRIRPSFAAKRSSGSGPARRSIGLWPYLAVSEQTPRNWSRQATSTPAVPDGLVADE